MLVKRVCSAEWKRPNLDLTELARHRWVLKWSISKLTEHFDRKKDTIVMHLCQMRKSSDWRSFSFSQDELTSIKANINIPFWGLK